MAFPIIAALAAQAASGLTNTFLQNKFNQDAADDNRLFASRQFEANKKMWYEMQAYNSPSSQLARLKAAGLNPALAYGGNSAIAGNTDAAPQLDYSGAQLAPPDVGRAFASGADMVHNAVQSEVASKQINNLDADIRLKETNSARNEAERDFILEKLPFIGPYMQAQTLTQVAMQSKLYKDVEAMSEQIKLYASQTKLNDEKKKSLTIMNDIQSAAKESIIASYGLHNSLLESQIKLNEKKLKVFDAEIDKCKWACNLMYEQASTLSEARWNIDLEGERIKAATNEINALVEKMKAETGLTEKECKYYLYTKSIPLISAGVIAGSHVVSTALKSFSPAGPASSLTDFAKSIMEGSRPGVKFDPYVMSNPYLPMQ